MFHSSLKKDAIAFRMSVSRLIYVFFMLSYLLLRNPLLNTECLILISPLEYFKIRDSVSFFT